MLFPHWPVARIVAFVLFVVGAVIALVAPDVDVKFLWALALSGGAALALS